MVPQHAIVLDSGPQDGYTDTRHLLFNWDILRLRVSGEMPVSETEHLVMCPFLCQRRKPSQALPHMSLVRTKLHDILVCMKNPPTHPGLLCLNTWCLADCMSEQFEKMIDALEAGDLVEGVCHWGQALRSRRHSPSFSSLCASLLPVSHDQLGSCCCCWDAK